jgi:SAM-dependent methyltransferase
MHNQARHFTLFVKELFPEFFNQQLKILDVGSGDINGNNRFLFCSEIEYHGNDVCAAKNVTIVSKTKDLPFKEETFDVIVSTECFEHDPEYEQSFQKIVKMLKPSGLFFFTCASTGRAEHGTMRSHPNCSFGTISKQADMQDYYKNLTIEDVGKAIDLSVFKTKAAFFNTISHDLYFYGIKSSELMNVSKDYIEKGVVHV